MLIGQIFGILIVYLTAYFIKKNYISISIAFVFILFAAFGSLYTSGTSSLKDSNYSQSNYDTALGIFVIDVIMFGLFFYLIRRNRQTKLNSGDVINKNE